ncbi:TIGR03885 family FMN-dependent LLM class oxidoreductase [Microbacterium oryzae]|uniref:TIGR03885 family FMN-dependent LLM class oxidoreductase n=1 Tax=Microbacterium oryzae TaxID=743009 RepID=UPI0025B0515B|nr:TIGR03885 family FMN-dependent LLM class oxidoreductase [Microbacterium oryzae]MDN3310158.1 TIGR03885 family FMN-dependent LLM class oxidoreductase [Microbacterium oryzae]
MFFGYHASHEQLPPSALLSAVQLAESVGFEGAMCSDHLAPWGRAQGESGFAWSWLGAALATTRFGFGVVTAPGQRYHPVITAHAIASLGEMFPGRFWAALGSGERMNEHVTGDPWPEKGERDRRLDECAAIIRRLLAGERVDHEGAVRVHEARLWSLPAAIPSLVAAAISPQTAARVAGWADGLITTGTDADALGDTVSAYREAGGQGEVSLQLHLSIDASRERAADIARDQWRHGAVSEVSPWDVAQPEDFDRLAEEADEDPAETVLVGDDPRELADRIRALTAGVDRVYLHHVGQDQRGFLEEHAPALLAELRGAR